MTQTYLSLVGVETSSVMCVVEIEKALLVVKCGCCGWPYCRHPITFPNDLQICCISEEAELLYKTKMEVEQMKKILDPLDIPPSAIPFLAGYERTFDLKSATDDAEVKDKQDW
jgi:hypothetical protein